MTNHAIASMHDESPKTVLDGDSWESSNPKTVLADGDSWESSKPISQSEHMVTDSLHAEFCKDTRAVLIDLMQKEGQAHFSSWLLYDALGSDLYEKITTTPEYYICRAETEVLTKHLDNFAKWSESERHVLVELGAGVGTKTHQMLPTLEQHAPGGDLLYAPIDVDAWALQENKQRLAKLHPKMKFEAFEGLFEEALPRAMQLTGRKTILFQGSTFGNFKTNADQLDFLRLIKRYMSPGDRLVLGVDSAPIPGKKSEEVVHDCYRKNTNGYRTEFMLNGLTNAARKCGLDLDRKQWKRITEWDNEELCVSHYYETLEDVTVHKVETMEVVRKFKKGERMLAQTHFKYTDDKLAGMAKEVGMCLSRTFKADSEYFMWAELILD